MHIQRTEMEIDDARHGLGEGGIPTTDLELTNSRLSTVRIRQFDDGVGVTWTDDDGTERSLFLETVNRQYQGVTLSDNSPIRHWEELPSDLHPCLHNLGFTVVSDTAVDDF